MLNGLFEDDILFSQNGKAPSPYQDYHYITITKKEVIYRTWKITPRKTKGMPNENKLTHLEFQDSTEIHNDIRRVFGKNVLVYILNLINGQLDYFPRLSKYLILKILSNLEIRDIFNLSQVSKQFHILTNNNDLLEKLILKSNKIKITEEIKELSLNNGWKQLLFSNKEKLKEIFSQNTKIKSTSLEIPQSLQEVPKSCSYPLSFDNRKEGCDMLASIDDPLTDDRQIMYKFKSESEDLLKLANNFKIDFSKGDDIFSDSPRYNKNNHNNNNNNINNNSINFNTIKKLNEKNNIYKQNKTSKNIKVTLTSIDKKSYMSKSECSTPQKNHHKNNSNKYTNDKINNDGRVTVLNAFESLKFPLINEQDVNKKSNYPNLMRKKNYSRLSPLESPKNLFRNLKKLPKDLNLNSVSLDDKYNGARPKERNSKILNKNGISSNDLSFDLNDHAIFYKN